MENQYAIEMKNISKSFPGIKANDNISINLKYGEIHALLGENGAGKSTLMSILFGLYTPDEGEILINGKPTQVKNPNDATKYGIGMVHQHFKLVECYTALQNIILGYEPTKFGFLRPKQVRESIIELCKKYKFNINIDEKIENMSVGDQQKVEILKMLYRKNDILIFDEPTAVLTPQEIKDLMASMRELVAEGKSILFISHKLNEIMEVADRVSVLRKGKLVKTLEVKDTNVTELSRLMVGRDVELVTHKDEHTPGSPVLTVKNLTVYNEEKKKEVVKNVSFEVKKGQIVCIAGIEGNGQTDLVYGITGIENTKSGEIILHDVDTRHYINAYLKERNIEKTSKTSIFLKNLFKVFYYIKYVISFGTNAIKFAFINLFRLIRHCYEYVKFGIKYAINLIIFACSNFIGNSILKLFKKNVTGKEFKRPKLNGEKLFAAYSYVKPTSFKTLENIPEKIDVHLEELSIRYRNMAGVAHIPEDRHKHGLVLDFSLRDNLVLQRYFEPKFEFSGMVKNKNKEEYAESLLSAFDIRSGEGTNSIVRSMSGGNQQKAIIGREIDRATPLLIAVQPTRGLDVGAIEHVHKNLINARDNDRAVLLVSLELDEVMNLSDVIFVMFNGEIVAKLNPKETNVNEIGLYMSGAKRMSKEEIEEDK